MELTDEFKERIEIARDRTEQRYRKGELTGGERKCLLTCLNLAEDICVPGDPLITVDQADGIVSAISDGRTPSLPARAYRYFHKRRYDGFEAPLEL